VRGGAEYQASVAPRKTLDKFAPEYCGASGACTKDELN
jgi:hypothetical protein